MQTWAEFNENTKEMKRHLAVLLKKKGSTNNKALWIFTG